MNIIESNCDCEKCSNMCKGPCCGTPQDIDALIDAGYANRLMLDDLPDINDVDLIKPALKGYEGEQSPWETRSEQGCTFWKKGKCELHDCGLKPLQGKLAHHTQDINETILIGELVCEDWKTDIGAKVIEKWKSSVNYEKKDF